MSKKIIMVIAQEGFRDEELLEPKALFEERGYDVQIASPEKGLCKGMLGAVLESDVALADVVIDKTVAALVVVGGANSPSLMDYPVLGKILKDVRSKNIVLGAICLAPMIVASFGVIDEIHATVYKTDDSMSMFKNHKIIYFQEDVLVDEKIVTANGPHAATIFAEEVLSTI
ncbi:DJ-1/PfpI family protein [Candidatus Woesearchaeota archaeon]|nr:DJ-1/PfpI family protein [Candidatus Woesearchaeota archaeon]